MDGKEHIIELGKVLAAEERQSFDDSTLQGGLDQFLAEWRIRANGALEHEQVQHTLELLQNYASLDITARRARIGIALESLRSLFRARPAPPVSPPQPKPRSTSSQDKVAKPVTLETPMQDISGVGKANAQAFRRLGVRTVYDLLYHFPHRYDDFTSQKQIVDLEIGSVETVIGEVIDLRTFSMRSGGSAIEVVVGDDSGTLKVVFFRQPWLAKQFAIGTKIVLSGKVDSYQGLRQLSGPDWEPYTDDERIHTGRLVPVHPLTKGLIERNARRIIKQVVDRAAPLVEDYLPEAVRERAGLMPLAEALTGIHFPNDYAHLTRARTRLGFDEFLFIQLRVLQRKLLWQGERGYAMVFNQTVHDEFLAHLPFSLTGAQQRTLGELFKDMSHPVPMARLLQGDVGSGKTVVAAATALQSIANGFQSAIMAPTEILAEQHYKGLRSLLSKVHVPRGEAVVAQREAREQIDDGSVKPRRQPRAEKDWRDELDPAQLARLDEIKRLIGMAPEDDLDGQGVRVALLTGSLGAKDRRRVLEGIENGDVDLVIGTHALIAERVKYAQLGAVVIDEQHRFGVEQRQRLKDKGYNPHLLVMTATPIPRTLTLTLFGDLDTSVLDELPPGRQEIKTRWITTVEREKAYKHIRREVERGRQVFVVCPLVDESEKVDLPSAEEMYAKLAGEVFPELRVTLVHGRMSAREKDSVMLSFRDHEYDILVATAVIEVGIDVPNATTMLIEGAERFGLAQLHQFRGRVGRGIHQSYCILVSDKDNEVTTKRLEAMETTLDGFKLAETDLELRGPGEFFGTRQSGTPDLKIAGLGDTRLLTAAHREAQKILAEDAELSNPEHAALKAKVDAFWSDVLQAG
ncbi:MAG: ATP-dependent DNA helicase RecG [Chloroflexi bacterium AL-W]|nr:ATP-dependent DNA helicase RecG [Chloroflexi bacterium AL-N1]NOK67010.1 ATP-dependent DNA helicase RecG [Chloroflexi bacterium AL-N10]NOK74698.1 ATP-dependent DNA helicase RecG [Chloroflexi bacterium AL-N5]NOK81612.1 ATP-dependent DNA helicase RecG [Chloroflexi bacterium AL-W]NOK89082.1 ATP-dependent DNA helicase RecG [Chloroflexi bacterium AL-N15]